MEGATLPYRFRSAAILGVAIVTSASGDVIFDQVGALDGSDQVNWTHASMQFSPSPPIGLDIAAVEDFQLTSTWNLNAMYAVLNGWSSFAGPSGVIEYEVNIYSSIDSPSTSLTGDILSIRSEGLIVDNWSGAGDLIEIALDFDLPAGEWFISVMAINPFPDNGYAGIMNSELGNDLSWQACPDTVYAFAPLLANASNLAYRLEGQAIPAGSAAVAMLLPCLRSRRRR